MKIKAIMNKNISSFEFAFDLSKDNTLSNILKLYNLEKVYICVYSQTQDRINKHKGVIFDRYYENKNDFIFIVEIMVENIGSLLQVLQGDFEELVVWNCYTNFERFIKDTITPSSFFTLKKINAVTNDSQFYLSYNHVDNIVDIICDIDIDNNVSKEMLIEILDK